MDDTAGFLRPRASDLAERLLHRDIERLQNELVRIPIAVQVRASRRTPGILQRSSLITFEGEERDGVVQHLVGQPRVARFEWARRDRLRGVDQ